MASYWPAINTSLGNLGVPVSSATDSAQTCLRKIRIDKTGQYAWMFSGGQLGPVAADFLQTELDRAPGITIENIPKLMRECGNRSWQSATSANNNTVLILIAGM